MEHMLFSDPIVLNAKRYGEKRRPFRLKVKDLRTRNLISGSINWHMLYKVKGFKKAIK